VEGDRCGAADGARHTQGGGDGRGEGGI